MIKSAAFFDVDRTLLPHNTMERLFLRHLLHKGYLGSKNVWRYLSSAVRYMLNSRTKLAWTQNKHHLRHLEPDLMERLAAECFQERIRPLISCQGRKAVLEHQQEGHLLVLLTGSLEPLARQLGQELRADLVLASRLQTHNGVLTGALANQRPYGPEKARLVREVAREHNLALDSCFAYGDHHSDAQVLQTVGHPRAVNPDSILRKEAMQRGWKVLRF